MMIQPINRMVMVFFKVSEILANKTCHAGCEEMDIHVPVKFCKVKAVVLV